MANEIKRIQNRDLPEEVRMAIFDIILHRRQIRRTAVLTYIPGIAALIGAGELLMHYYGIDPPLGERIKAYALGPLAPASILAYTHRTIYYSEEAKLFNELRNSKNKEIQRLLGSFPYIVVDWKGNLIGKKSNPKIGFFSIGRRRIPTKNPPTKPRNRIRATRRFLGKKNQE